MNKVAVVILNYNSSTDCEKCVKFLLAQTDIEVYIVIVDNCSCAEDVDKVKTLCDYYSITYIEANENRGYSAGNNIGIRHAVELGYKYVMIANPDMEFHQTNYLSKMINVMRSDPNIAVCGSDIIDLKGQHQNPFYVNSYWDDLCFELWNKKKKDSSRLFWNKSRYCEAVHGCCMLLQSNFLKSTGYLDENTFLYCEERILSRKVVLNKYRMYYLSDVHAIHHHVAKSKGNYAKNLRLLFNSRKYYYKNYTDCGKLKRFFLILSWDLQLIFNPLFRDVVFFFKQ